MANPRYLTENGEPQVELLKKLSMAKEVYLSNLEEFCKKEGMLWEIENFKTIDGVFLIGSHAEEEKWNNLTSDLDLKLINSKALPANLWMYKKKILDPKLCPQGTEKQYWIDLFFAVKDYQVLEPKFDLTKYWNSDI
jgi:hypothetical protein